MTTEETLQQKKKNLYTTLQSTFQIQDSQLVQIDGHLSGQPLTFFATTHLSAPGVDFGALAVRFVSYLGVGVSDDERYNGCCQLVEAYLRCFAAFVQDHHD